MYQYLVGFLLLLGFSKMAISLEEAAQPLLSEKNISRQAETKNSLTTLCPKEIKLYLSETCVICMDESALLTVVPCGHNCVCCECSNELLYRYGCPICRAPMEAVYGSSDLAKYQSGELKPEPHELSYEEDSFTEERSGGFWCCFDAFNACCNSLCSCFCLPFPED